MGGYVIISETDVNAYVLGDGDRWGTLPNIAPRVFSRRLYAKVYLRRMRVGGRALGNPGPCRIISARAAGVEAVQS